MSWIYYMHESDSPLIGMGRNKETGSWDKGVVKFGDERGAGQGGAKYLKRSRVRTVSVT